VHAFLAAIAKFRVPDDRMAMPYHINFSKHLLRADFDAVPAGLTTLVIKKDEISFSSAR
jgi:hypothetical protein